MSKLDTALDHCLVPLLSNLDATNPSPFETQSEIGHGAGFGLVLPISFAFCPQDISSLFTDYIANTKEGSNCTLNFDKYF